MNLQYFRLFPDLVAHCELKLLLIAYNIKFRIISDNVSCQAIIHLFVQTEILRVAQFHDV